jgi:hypothetical protein
MASMGRKCLSASLQLNMAGKWLDARVFKCKKGIANTAGEFDWGHVSVLFRRAKAFARLTLGGFQNTNYGIASFSLVERHIILAAAHAFSREIVL